MVGGGYFFVGGNDTDLRRDVFCIGPWQIGMSRHSSEQSQGADERKIAGAGVGMLSMIVPVYQAELSPAEHRGQLACVEFSINILGYASSVWVDWLFTAFHSNFSWRGPLAVQVVIGLFLAIGSLFLPVRPL